LGRYLAYYIPCLKWLRQYKSSFLVDDLVSALSVASIYLPMVLSFADSLAHVPPINGLYSFVFNPLIYAIFGSSPALMVGPDATASLLVGTIVRRSMDDADGDADLVLQARICGIVAGVSGATILVAGIARLGFLEGVFSRPFLRGFISAVGFVIFVEQLVPQTGLVEEAKRAGVSHGSSVEKLAFLIRNLEKVHVLTAIVAGTCFVVLLSLRLAKPNGLQAPDFTANVALGT
jgi:MFS superfamily sulfate permease-like transporter